MAKQRTRSMRLAVHEAKKEGTWGDTKLVLIDYGNRDSTKRVTIDIYGPTDIRYLREKLDQIEAYWRQCLDNLKS